MIYRQMGTTGIQVSALGLGAMPLSIEGRPEESQAVQVIETFLDLGGNFIDTANVYCLDDGDIGHNERLVRRALTDLGKGDKVVVATKGGLRRPRGGWVTDGSPAWLRESCERSLRDLGVERITLYQLHAVDARVGLLPSLEALIRLREQGKIRHIGLSNVSLDQLQQALDLTAIATVQNRCNPFEKDDLKNGMIDFCREQGISYIPHSPVGGHHGHVRLGRPGLLSGLARKYGVSAYQVVLAWFLSKGEHIIPIPGASKVTSIRDSMAAVDLMLEPEDIRAIDGMPDDE
ncbi:MAG: aldo/keto reductase [Proteobacteria bacterium]|nr:aldo/keto reductase [Pseudomonadota bacterium]